MTNKGKLKRAERLEISILLKKDYSFREIGQALGRSHNTIAYEAKSNSTNGEYDPIKANAKARLRKRMSKFQWKKIEENKELKKPHNHRTEKTLESGRNIGKNEKRKTTVLRKQNSYLRMAEIKPRTILLPVSVFSKIPKEEKREKQNNQNDDSGKS